ncbi:hypothetical protein C8R45DRAFT_1078901, partial [Mycena sanguinolenta]
MSDHDPLPFASPFPSLISHESQIAKPDWFSLPHFCSISRGRADPTATAPVPQAAVAKSCHATFHFPLRNPSACYAWCQYHLLATIGKGKSVSKYVRDAGLLGQFTGAALSWTASSERATDEEAKTRASAFAVLALHLATMTAPHQCNWAQIGNAQLRSSWIAGKPSTRAVI